MVDSTLFDLDCLRKGLPPMSGSPQEIFKMIVNTSPEEKRKINRKIRKIAKSYIKIVGQYNKRRSQYLQSTINGDRSSQRTPTRHALNRIRLAKTHLMSKFSEGLSGPNKNYT